MHCWSIVTQSESPSSHPTLSPKPARVRLRTFFSSILVAAFGQLHVTISLAELLLVDLADACLGNAVDEQNLLRNSVFRDNAFVGEHLEVVLDSGVADAIRIGPPLDHEGEWPLTPFLVLDADDGRLR